MNVNAKNLPKKVTKCHNRTRTTHHAPVRYFFKLAPAPEHLVLGCRAGGCCGPMPRRSPDSSATRALLSLAVAVCYRCASACAHSTVATPAGNAHRACQMSRALIPACGLYVKRPVSDLPPRLPQPRTNLKGGRRACRRPQVSTGRGADKHRKGAPPCAESHRPP